MDGNILVIDPDEMHSQRFRRALTNLPLIAEYYDSIEDLPSQLDITKYQAIIIDLDDKMPAKATLKAWRRQNSQLSILGFSAQNFHPNLSEVIGQYLFACLKKPIEADELTFFLKSIFDSFSGDDGGT